MIVFVVIVLAVIDPIVGIIAGGLITALAGLILQNRRLSGDIGASDAETLWAAADKQQQRLSDRMEMLEQRVQELDSANFALRNELLLKTTRIIELERELAQKTERCDALQRENVHLKTLIKTKLGDLDDEH